MDFFQRLPYDVFERILNRLDLPEIIRLRVLNHGFDNLISGDQFVSQYNRNRVSSLWLFFHVRGLGDNIGVLMAHRFDLHQRAREMLFPLAGPPFNVGDELRLLDISGSLFLFRRRTRHPADDEDQFLVSLSVVNPFRRQVHSVEVPNGLWIEFAGVRLSHEEQQPQQFRISHLSLNGNQVPTYSQFLSATNQWETLFHVATPIPDNQHLNTHHPMATIHYNQDGLITYLVSFLDGQPVFRTVPTHHLIGNAFQGFPVPHPPHGMAQLDFLIFYGPWAFKIYCHRDIHEVPWTRIVAVALARLRPDWTRYDRIHVSPPYTLWDNFYVIDLDAGFHVRQTGRHVSIGMVVALDLAHQWYLRTISYDLLGERWREVFAHVDGELEVGPPLFSDMLTL